MCAIDVCMYVYNMCMCVCVCVCVLASCRSCEKHVQKDDGCKGPLWVDLHTLLDYQ